MQQIPASLGATLALSLFVCADQARAQSTLVQLQLDAPLRCAVGERLQLALTGLDASRARTTLDPNAVRVRSTNSNAVSAAGRAPDMSVIEVSCRADGESWVLVDAPGARAWTRVLVGAARSNLAPPAPPPESAWNAQLATTTALTTTRTAPTIRATVVPPTVTLSLSTTAATVEQGGTLSVVAMPYDASGASIAGATVTWTSSNPAVASVDARGGVTGVEPGGPVTITAASGAATATATVAVTPIRARPSGAGTSFASAIVLGTLSSGASLTVSDYFESTADTERHYRVQVAWKQPAGCTAGSPSGTTFTATLTGIPAGRNFELERLGEASQVVQASTNPDNQDETISIAGVCGTASTTLNFRIRRSAGLPGSAPHTLKLNQSM